MWNVVLKNLRIEHNLTQNNIAKDLGITQATYGRYEIGDIEPKLTTILFLADFYDVSTDYLLGRTKYSIKANNELKIVLTKLQSDIEQIKKVL